VAADKLPARAPIRLRAARVRRVLGIALSADTVAEMFGRLGLDVVAMATTSSSRRRPTGSTWRSRKT
jgi:phenylalanyl-tRNA synthetase beta subunit